MTAQFVPSMETRKVNAQPPAYMVPIIETRAECRPQQNMSFIHVTLRLAGTGFVQTVLLDDIHKYTSDQWEVALAGRRGEPDIAGHDADSYQFVTQGECYANKLAKQAVVTMPRAWLEGPLRAAIQEVMATMPQAKAKPKTG